MVQRLNGKKTKRAAPVAEKTNHAAPAPSQEEEGGNEYQVGRVSLSSGLTELVAGILLSSVCSNAEHRKEMEASRQFTPEYRVFAAKRPPKAVQDWIRHNFRVGGPGYGALKSELDLYVDELGMWMDNALRYHNGHWCEPACNCNLPPFC